LHARGVSRQGVRDAVDAAAIRVDQEVAVVLDALADRVEQGGVASERGQGIARRLRASIGELTAAGDDDMRGSTWLYRDLAVAVNRLAASGGRSIPPAAPRSWLVSALSCVRQRQSRIHAGCRGDMDLDGTALKTNTDVERARSIRSLSRRLSRPGA